MVAPNARDIAKVPGRIIIDPTDLSAADPYGGTEFGITRDQEFAFQQAARTIRAEEFGVTVEDVVGAMDPIFAAVLRSWDDDAIATVFPDTEAGASGRRIVHGRTKGASAVRPGTLVSTRAVKLLFVPDAPDSHPWLIMYSALPSITKTAKLNLAIDTFLGTGVVFRGTPDSSGNVYDIFRKGDISI